MSQFDYSAEPSDDYSLNSYSQWLEENPWSFDMVNSFLPKPDNELQSAQNTCEYMLRFVHRADSDRHYSLGRIRA